MKCPYQTKVIHKPEYTDGYVKNFAEDITKFCECVKSECPFYYTSWAHKTESIVAGQRVRISKWQSINQG